MCAEFWYDTRDGGRKMQTMSNKKIVCIDSDGTALDTMNVKHIRCFGPCFVKGWGLDAHRQEVLARWNGINLYEKTRGKNRFITLYLILNELNGKLLQEDLSSLKGWLESGKELSNASLQREIAETGAPLLKKALAWSEDVNREIAKLTDDDKKPFDGAEAFLRSAQNRADIAVVSSAGGEALRQEWSSCGLDKYVNFLFSQEDGTKAQCLRLLTQKGYAPENILMVGDSFPDIQAAEECGVWFYPILAGKEKQSWENLKETCFGIFLAGAFQTVQEQCKKDFYKNLNAEE